MDAILPVGGYILLCLAMLAGLVITPLGLPGNWLILGCGVIYGFVTQWTKFEWPFIVLLLAAAVIGEIIEAVSSALGAKKFGASTGGTIAAIVGSIVGLILGTSLFPVIGSLMGAFAGAFLGAYLYEYIKLRDRDQAMRAGMGAFLGRTAATVVKEIIGVVMVGLIVYQFLE
jgi:uncharacterized protein YqgC (DUF456 family)